MCLLSCVRISCRNFSYLLTWDWLLYLGGEPMSKAKGKKEKSNRESPPTASFDSSVLGPGSQIGQFRIERELGRGAMGVVYLSHLMGNNPSQGSFTCLGRALNPDRC